MVDNHDGKIPPKLSLIISNLKSSRSSHSHSAKYTDKSLYAFLFYFRECSLIIALQT